MVPFPITEELRKLLAKFSMGFDAFSFIKSYAVIQCLYRIVTKKGWNHPYAAFRNEENYNYISEKFDIRWPVDYVQSPAFITEFQEIYSAIQPMSLKEFLSEFIVSELHPAQLTKTMDLLANMCPDSIEDQVLLFLLAKKVWLRHRLGAKNFPAESYESAVKNMVSDEQWRMLGYTVNCYDFSYKSRVMPAPEAAHKKLSSYHCPPEYQIALFGQFREYVLKSWTGRKRSWKKHITDVAHYVRKCLGGDPNIDFLDIDRAMNEAADSFSKIVKPTDFLEAVLVDATNDDSTIENGIVYSKFVDVLLPTDQVLVINPSPDWLCQYPNEYLKNTTFCVSNQPMAWVLEHEFVDTTFITFSQFTENACAADSNAPLFSKVLWFSREMKSSMLGEVTRSIKNSIDPNGIVFALLPSTEMTAKFFAADSFVSSFAIQRIDLLPSEAFRSAPQKKVLVQAINGHAGQPEKIKVTKYVFFEDSQKTKRLKRKNELPVELETELLHTAKSIHTLYRDKLRPPVTKTRKPPRAYAFTREITFWHIEKQTTDNRRIIEAYVSYFPTIQQEKRTKLPRGKKVEGAHVTSTKLNNDKEIEEWCENTVPYNSHIQKGVLEAFQIDDSALQSGRVTFKTLWYLQLCLNKREVNALVLAEKELFSSPVGNLFITEEFELIKVAMDEYCNGKTQGVQSELWNILSDVLDYAVKNGYLERNPVESFLQSLREKYDAAGASVRAALMKKTFHAEEEKKLLKFLLSEIPNNSEYIGVLIRFLTGLEPNIVCALTWEDFREIARNSGAFQFWIYQQVKNNGDGPVPLKRKEDFRRVPVVEILSRVLRSRREDIQQKLGIQEKELRKQQIIASDVQIQNGSGTVTPRRLNKLSQKAVTAIGIQEVVVDLPDDEHGTKETNLTKYRGDIFRTNFRYRANTCGCTDSEKRFILGNQQITSFGNNYCDYLNEFSQLSLYYKLHRWESDLLAETDEFPQMRRIDIPQKLSVQNGNRTNVILEIPLDKRAGDIMVRFHCKHGFSLSGDIFRMAGLYKR